jgi:hypothetical protein
MDAVFIAWAVSAAVLLLVAVGLGATIRGGPLGILIDSRGRYSLTQLQLVLWTVVIMSLIFGVFWGRLVGGLAANALDFSIPSELLIVLGISVGSTVTSSVIKAAKDADHPERVAASDSGDPPRFFQIFWVEEGAMADRAIDVTKFQNFWFTLILVVAYVALAIATLAKLGDISKLDSLPGFSAQFVTLLAISHGAYVAGKLPTPPGNPSGLSVRGLVDGWVPMQQAAAAQAAAVAAGLQPPRSYAPRNPNRRGTGRSDGGPS